MIAFLLLEVGAQPRGHLWGDGFEVLRAQKKYFGRVWYMVGVFRCGLL
jgi:hypothetical protein